MNTKNTLGILLAVVVTMSSMPTVSLAASQSTDTTKISQAINLKSAVDVSDLKNNSTKAIELAKNYFKEYMNIDIDAKLKDENERLKSYVSNPNAGIVEVKFDNTSQYCDENADDMKSLLSWMKLGLPFENYIVGIYLDDGKVAYINQNLDNTKGSLPNTSLLNEVKAKAEAENFLKKNGLFDGITTMEVNNDSGKYGIGKVTCKDASGNEICTIEMKDEDYSITGYNNLNHKNISDEQAIELAKKYFSQCMNINIDGEIQKYGLKTCVIKPNWKSGPPIAVVEFKAEKYKSYAAYIYLSDGELAGIYNDYAQAHESSDLSIDKTKAIASAEDFLKKSGLFDGVAKMTLDDSNIIYSGAGVTCYDANGKLLCIVGVEKEGYSVYSYDDRRYGVY